MCPWPRFCLEWGQKSNQIIPGKGMEDTLQCWGYWGCQAVKFLSDAIPWVYPWQPLPFCLFILARLQGPITKFSLITQERSTRITNTIFWRSQRDIFTMAMITASQTPPCRLWKPSRRKMADGVPKGDPNITTNVDKVSSHCKDTPDGAGEVHSTLHSSFEPQAPISFSKFTFSITHLPQVKSVVFSKPPRRKGINKTPLKPKQFTRVLGWNNPLSTQFPQFSLGLEHFSSQSTYEGYQKNLK